jgi:hypothetical protein
VPKSLKGSFLLARHIVAVALLAQPELQGLGSAFDRAWPLDEVPCFSGLLEAIDEADRQLSRERDREASSFEA